MPLKPYIETTISGFSLLIGWTASSYRRLQVEPLEVRWQLAIFVGRLADEAVGGLVDGGISLREVIALTPAAETIDFAPALIGSVASPTG